VNTHLQTIIHDERPAYMPSIIKLIKGEHQYHAGEHSLAMIGEEDTFIRMPTMRGTNVFHQLEQAFRENQPELRETVSHIPNNEGPHRDPAKPIE
jgi:hypothetical protein